MFQKHDFVHFFEVLGVPGKRDGARIELKLPDLEANEVRLAIFGALACLLANAVLLIGQTMELRLILFLRSLLPLLESHI